MRAEAKPAEKVPERRLWLTGSTESSPGVCGLYRTARTEPMGDRLRLLYHGDTRLSESWGKSQDQQGTRAARQALYKAWKSGWVWGWGDCCKMSDGDCTAWALSRSGAGQM